MIPGSNRFILCTIMLVTFLVGKQATRAAEPEFPPEQLKFFEEKIRPLLSNECYACHSAGKQEGELRLDARSLMIEGGESGPAIEPGKPEESTLIEAVRYESFEMPPAKRLSEDKVELLTKWVKMGAPWPAGEKIEESRDEWAERVESGKHHWAFQPLKEKNVPEIPNDDWSNAAVDRFVLNKLIQNNMSPAPAASKKQLIRRVTYDLTGLPPSPEEIQTFLNDDSPEAYTQLIDRLLASPHYGEKWGRHWLDLVRYAESNSYERDGAKPFVWRYRDYIINALNEDKPYDEFVKQQLAGDEFAEHDPESIIATGYYRLGIWDDEPADRELAFFDDTNDIVQTTGEVFMGLTLGCARCHEHKLDPISHQDYYEFLSYFRNVKRFGIRAGSTIETNSIRVIATPEEQKRHQAAVKLHKAQMTELDKQLAELAKPVVDQLQGVDVEEFKHDNRRLDILKKFSPKLISQESVQKYAQLASERNQLKKSPPSGLDKALCVKETGPDPLPTFVMIRGNAHVPGEQVEPAGLQALAETAPPVETPVPLVNSTGRRRALANWITSSEHPLTARVIVNRVWQYHFGRGIVRSTSNFGLAGDPPTHPDLLDWLALELIRNDWSLKSLHRTILLSSTYQMSSQSREDYVEKDPLNNLFWRFNMRRLTAEEVRDSVLSASGKLNDTTMFGPSIYSDIPAEVKAGQSQPGLGWGDSEPFQRYRRSIYIHAKRSLITPILASFDLAEMDASCPVRFVTTQPTQALGMLNSQFINEQANFFADSILSETNQTNLSDAELVKKILQRVLQRELTQEEVNRGASLVSRLQSEQGLSRSQAFRSFCLLALNLNEFVYLD